MDYRFSASAELLFMTVCGEGVEWTILFYCFWWYDIYWLVFSYIVFAFGCVLCAFSNVCFVCISVWLSIFAHLSPIAAHCWQDPDHCPENIRGGWCRASSRGTAEGGALYQTGSTHVAMATQNEHEEVSLKGFTPDPPWLTTWKCVWKK